jgi:hypothetical protein
MKGALEWLFKSPDIRGRLRLLPHEIQELYFARLDSSDCLSLESRDGQIQHVREIDDALAFAVENSLEDS